MLTGLRDFFGRLTDPVSCFYFPDTGFYILNLLNPLLFLSYVNFFKSSFLEDLLIQSLAFPFLVLNSYFKFTQPPFIFILC